jgi:hypothetical protein
MCRRHFGLWLCRYNPSIVIATQEASMAMSTPSPVSTIVVTINDNNNETFRPSLLPQSPPAKSNHPSSPTPPK